MRGVILFSFCFSVISILSGRVFLFFSAEAVLTDAKTKDQSTQKRWISFYVDILIAYVFAFLCFMSCDTQLLRFPLFLYFYVCTFILAVTAVILSFFRVHALCRFFRFYPPSTLGGHVEVA